MAHSKTDFSKGLDHYYQSDADFELSVKLFNSFPFEVVTMKGEDLAEAHRLLPEVNIETLKRIKTKCNVKCSCPREHNALDLIKFSVNVPGHDAKFLTAIFNENRKDKKLSIMDSVHKADWLPDSVVYLDDTKDIPCAKCGEGIHLYLLADSICHHWH